MDVHSEQSQKSYHRTVYDGSSTGFSDGKEIRTMPFGGGMLSVQRQITPRMNPSIGRSRNTGIGIIGAGGIFRCGAPSHTQWMHRRGHWYYITTHFLYADCQ